MKERPILFSAPMVRAILDGRKTQTRRIVKPQPERDEQYGGFHWPSHAARSMLTIKDMSAACPYGTRGERLWVRETHAPFSVGEGLDTPVPECVAYRATCEDDGFDYVNGRGEVTHLTVTKWTPSIFMPRWASRIDLEVTGVRVERLHDISEDDAKAEGISKTHYGEWSFDGKRVTGRPWAHSYFILWNEINGRESWDANPFVWVVEFRRVEAQERAA